MTLISYEAVPINECHEPLVDAAATFTIDATYFKQGLTTDCRILMRKSVVQKLIAIELKLIDYKFLIWDGYRSRETQSAIYNRYWTELHTQHPDWNNDRLAVEVGTFVTKSSEKRIPPHTTGGAVDLTLLTKAGRQLDMGTKFDYFGPEAAALYFEENRTNPVVQHNRKILREAMQAEGFRIEPEEWWHFDYGNQLWATTMHKPYALYGEIPTSTSGS